MLSQGYMYTLSIVVRVDVSCQPLGSFQREIIFGLYFFHVQIMREPLTYFLKIKYIMSNPYGVYFNGAVLVCRMLWAVSNMILFLGNFDSNIFLLVVRFAIYIFDWLTCLPLKWIVV